MKARVAMVAALMSLGAASAVVSLHAQTAPAAKPAAKPVAAKVYAAKTPWGDPDLQGVWDYKTITPLERPANFGDPSKVRIYQSPAKGQPLPTTPSLELTPFPDFTGGVFVG